VSIVLVLVFLVGVGLLASSAVGRLVSAAWRHRETTDAVHPWALAAPRILLAVPIVGLAIASTALLPGAPWLWLSGLCACEALGGLHVCPFHLAHAATLVVTTAAVSAALLAPRLWALAGVWRRMQDLEHLASTGEPDDGAIGSVDDGGRPLAFVAGLHKPRLFVERTWWSRLDPRDKAVILAHEQSHIDARDSWTMFVLDLMLTLVAPGARSRILDDWGLATEIRADADAAAKDGDPIHVATVLCRYARAGAPAGTLGFGGRGLDARVRSLLDGRTPDRQRRAWTPRLVFAVACAACCVGHLTHRLFEAVLVALA
jgi:Zn-dependent protease with chaperone function